MEIHEDIDKKPRADHVDDAVSEPAGSSRLQVPPLVAAMSQEQRVAAETKLRKKIDTRLLPMIILMYIMNYLDRNNIAAVRLAGLQDELNLSSVQYQVGRERPSDHNTADNSTDYRLNPLRRIRRSTGPFKSIPEQVRKAGALFAIVHDRLGRHQRIDRSLPELLWPRCMSVLSRVYRGSLFSWMFVLSVLLVHTQRAGFADCSALLGIVDIRSVRWSHYGWDYKQHGRNAWSARMEVGLYSRGHHNRHYSLLCVLDLAKFPAHHEVAERGRAPARCISVAGGYRRRRLDLRRGTDVLPWVQACVGGHQDLDLHDLASVNRFVCLCNQLFSGTDKTSSSFE